MDDTQRKLARLRSIALFKLIEHGGGGFEIADDELFNMVGIIAISMGQRTFEVLDEHHDELKHVMSFAGTRNGKRVEVALVMPPQKALVGGDR